MKLRFLLLILACASLSSFASDWKPAENTMLTPWGEKVTPDNAWRDYPRPQMVRENWTNLNGLWKFAVTKNTAARPSEWESEILVPFALETPLSGVGRRLEPSEVIWYHHEFNLKAAPKDRLLLNFEGVDYKCMVWVNGEMVGDHIGGNLPFGFDITDAAKRGKNSIELRVVDGTDDPDLYQLRGKQKRNNSGIWYTPSSGIWATVWLEEVANTYIDRLEVLADMHGQLKAKAHLDGADQDVQLKVTVSDDGKVVKKQDGFQNTVSLSIPNAKLWSPDSPNLYDLEFELFDKDGNLLDTVTSYTGLRSVGKAVDANGNWQFTLNGKKIFHWGPLDQGWWPGSFLNPPADEAIVWEMEYLKAAGFNMIRKHKKAEPRRYYYHADKIGMLVWQDQTSGGAGPNEWPKWKKLRGDADDYEPRNERWWSSKDDALEADWPDWAHEQYMAELKSMIDLLYSHPSIVVWTTFNERWGQHRSTEVGEWTKAYDSSRHLNIASGGNFFPVTDIADEHDYPDPTFPLESPVYDDFIKVIGEFGGHGWPVEGHLWDTSFNNWGYGGLPQSIEEWMERYERTANFLGEFKKKGITAGVYTQTTDVEGELNGLITYDRKVMKMTPEQLAEIHRDAGLID
ncbi:glycoside hydrolase family 2 [Opitutia bacterium ISCC 51]|nr:glycoside hydrolase family 2 [Opitutae bacterium ISCC 51]QXD26652.1 glycoside hydrolase family 2 [Opitutae bacterium ISCC 52]